jgi:hypothetical protein
MLNSHFFANFKPYLWPWQHADLIQQMAARDINARFRQSWLGLAWLVLTPLLMLGVYTLVFREVFQARWGAPDEGVLAYALRLYAGLAVFNFFAEYVNRSPAFVIEQPHLVKKVVFPLEVMAWVNLGIGLGQFGGGGFGFVDASLSWPRQHSLERIVAACNVVAAGAALLGPGLGIQCIGHLCARCGAGVVDGDVGFGVCQPCVFSGGSVA